MNLCPRNKEINFIGTLGRFWLFLLKFCFSRPPLGEIAADFFHFESDNRLKTSLETFLILSFYPKIWGLYVVFWPLTRDQKNHQNLDFRSSFSGTLFSVMKRAKVCRINGSKNATVSDWFTSEHFLMVFSKIAKMLFLYLGSFSLG